MKTVSQILARIGPQFNTIDAETRVVDALSVMKMEQTSFIIVTRNGQYTGIVTERDYAQKVLLMGKSSHLTKVEDIMSCNLPAVSSGDPVEKCMMLMNAYKTRYLPVFDDFEFKAIITMQDIIALSMSDKEYDDLLRFNSEKVF